MLLRTRQTELLIGFLEFVEFQTLLVYQLVFFAHVIAEVSKFKGLQLDALLVLRFKAEVLGGAVVELFLQEVLGLGAKLV